MGIDIRQAELERDRRSILHTLIQYLSPNLSEQRFDWLYERNPAGKAMVWLAVDHKTQAIVGSAAAFPRNMIVHGKKEVGWVLGDFCVDSHYRSLGPALQLQRACLEGVNSNRIPFWYDFPSSNMMAVYKRLGVTADGEMYRLVKPLRIDRKIGKVLGETFVSKGISYVGNRTLAFKDDRQKADIDVEISQLTGAYGEEFSVLSEEVKDVYGSYICRSASYLNWRYREDPDRGSECVTARSKDKLLAFAVFSQQGEEVTLEDLFGVHEKNIVVNLMVELVEKLRRQGVMMLRTYLLPSNPWFSLLTQMGFKVREPKPVVMSWPRQDLTEDEPAQHARVFLMNGDRDS